MPDLLIFSISAFCTVAVQVPLRGHLAVFISLPSTFLHELAHYLVAYLTGSNPSPIDLVPRRTTKGWVLGSVEFETGALSASFVALAPLLLLLAAWGVLLFANGATALEQFYAGVIFAVLLQGSVPSKGDLKIVLKYPIGVGLATLIILALLH